MYSASPITASLFGFQAEGGYLEPWVAIAQIADKEQPDHNRLELCARIFLPELDSPEQYEGLLEAVRSFTRGQMAEKGCESCLIYYTCKGIVDRDLNLPLPGMPYPGGRLAVECEFVETYRAEQADGPGEEGCADVS
ncbi:hypothetical protein [Cohnella sp. 56]|uniref:hypothetical protein n=1 Tax=Cohnella sp. 56 TaxID=3113722 RepID=UPI0030E84ADE